MISSNVGLLLGISLAAIAGANVWLMLGTAGNRPRQVRLHRLGGYLFAALFCVTFFYMNQKVSGVTRGLPITIVIHSALAFLLVPLLVLKIVIARRYKHHSGALLALGLAIFVVTFVLVAITSFPVLWAADVLGNIRLLVNLGVIALVVVVFGALFLRRPKVPSPAIAAPAADSDRRQPAQAPAALQQSGAKKSLLLLLSRIQVQTHDTKTLRFLLPLHEKIHVRPGQFMTFHWIINGKALARSYSICSSPLQAGYLEITVKRAEDGCVSAFLNQRARIGLTVEAQGPSGQFCFDESQDTRIVLIAGGSGITPMMSMLRYIDDLGLATEVTLLYFARTSQDIIFATELAKLRSSIRNFRYTVILSRSDESWTGATGYLTRELLDDNVSHIHASTFFLCGPAPLMKSARSILHSLGVPDTQIRQESFGGRPAPYSAPSEHQTSGKLVLARSGRSCDLLAGKTLLESAEASGIFLSFSCRQGECGTCALRVLSGRIRMDKEDGLYPGQKEQGYALACVAHGEGSVTVDL
jgi:ferredoxin-NADP reductase